MVLTFHLMTWSLYTRYPQKAQFWGAFLNIKVKIKFWKLSVYGQFLLLGVFAVKNIMITDVVFFNKAWQISQFSSLNSRSTSNSLSKQCKKQKNIIYVHELVFKASSQFDLWLDYRKYCACISVMNILKITTRNNISQN